MKEEAETEETTGGALSAAELWGERAESIVRYVTQSGKPQPLTALGAFMARKGWQLPMVSCVLEYIEKAKLLSRFETSSGAVAYKLPMTRVTESGDDYVTGAIEKATETAAAKQAQAVRAQRIREFASRKKPAPAPTARTITVTGTIRAPAPTPTFAEFAAQLPAPPVTVLATPLPKAPAEPVVEEETTMATEDTIDSAGAAGRLGISVTAFNSRVARRGVKPVSVGSGRGQMSMYRLADVQALATRMPATGGRKASKQTAVKPAKPVKQAKRAKLQRAPKAAVAPAASTAPLDRSVRLLVECVDADILTRDQAWDRLRALVAA